MEKLVYVEVISADGSVRERKALTEEPLRIGRELDNDIVIDDEAISAHHARIEWDADHGFRLQNCGSANGLFDVKKRSLEESIVASDGVVVRLGHTDVRFSFTGSRAKTVPIEHSKSASIKQISKVWLLSWLLALGLMAADTWFSSFPKDRTDAMLKACGVIFCVFVFWILFWGTIGRLFTSKARLAEHGRIIGIGISVLFIGGDLLPPMAYASAAWKFFFFLDQLMGLILFTWIFYQHACLCRRSTSGRKRVLVSASLFSIGLIAMAWTNNHLERKEFSLSIASISEIYPPMFRISKPETLDDFFADVDSLKEEVDELAQKKSD